MKKLILIAALVAGSAQAQYQSYYDPSNQPQGYSQQLNNNTSTYYDNTGRPLGSSYSYGGQTTYVDQYNRQASPQQMYQQPSRDNYNPGTAINNRYQGYSR